MREKVITVPCGDASQRIKWLGCVAIARWDESNYQGWKELGEPTLRSPGRAKADCPVTPRVPPPPGQPTAVLTEGGEQLDLGMPIKEMLEDGDTVIVKHSLERESARARGLFLRDSPYLTSAPNPPPTPAPDPPSAVG